MNFPLSINHRQCLGACYYKNTTIIHPINYSLITNTKDAFCPVFDPTDNNEYHDICLNPTEKEYKSTSNVQISHLTPTIFLYKVYNINSFYEGLQWINNNKDKNMLTKIRIINACLAAYEIEYNLLDEIFINFFIEYIKYQEYEFMITHLYKYINVTDNKVNLHVNELKLDEYKEERKKFIIDILLEQSFIKKFLTKKLDLTQTNNHLHYLTFLFIEYIIKKTKK